MFAPPEKPNGPQPARKRGNTPQWRTVGDMARIIIYIVVAVAVLVLLWVLLATLLHTLIVGFWIVLAVLLGFGMYRVGRRTGRGSRG